MRKEPELLKFSECLVCKKDCENCNKREKFIAQLERIPKFNAEKGNKKLEYGAMKTKEDYLRFHNFSNFESQYFFSFYGIDGIITEKYFYGESTITCNWNSEHLIKIFETINIESNCTGIQGIYFSQPTKTLLVYWSTNEYVLEKYCFILSFKEKLNCRNLQIKSN